MSITECIVDTNFVDEGQQRMIRQAIRLSHIIYVIESEGAEEVTESKQKD